MQGDIWPSNRQGGYLDNFMKGNAGSWDEMNVYGGGEGSINPRLEPGGAKGQEQGSFEVVPRWLRWGGPIGSAIK